MVSLPDIYRNPATDGVVDRLDTGAGANAQLRIRTAPAGTILLTFDLSDPAFGASSAGTATAAGLPKTATAAASGAAAFYEYLDKDGVQGPNGTDIGTSGNEVVITPSTSITSGNDYDLNAASFTMPAN